MNERGEETTTSTTASSASNDRQRDMPEAVKKGRLKTVLFHFGAHFIALMGILYVSHFSLPDTITAPLILCLILTTVSYAAIQGSDPGYVTPDTLPPSMTLHADRPLWHTDQEIAELTRNSQERTSSRDGNRDDNDDGSVNSEEILLDSDDSNSADRKERNEQNCMEEQEILRRNCIYCEQPKPPRAHHCRICNRCVHGFSHHCGVLRTCIGEKNACRFFWFLLFELLTTVLAVGSVHGALANGTSRSGMAIFLVILLWIITIMLFGGVVMNAWLAISNTTGFEARHRPEEITEFRNLDIRYPEVDMPFSKGIVKNLQEFCCISDGLCYSLFNKKWKPRHWRVPTQAEIEASENSENWLENPWRNRYWECC